MSTIIRQIVGERFENRHDVSESWDLRTQVEALEEWLRRRAAELDPAERWVADIGFNHRPDARGGGPPLTRAFMTMCLDANLEIWLSEYGLREDGG